MHCMKYLLSIAVLSVVPSVHFSDYIDKNVYGTFDDSPTFNFSIFARSFVGVLLYGNDSQGNELRIEVTSWRYGERNIILTFRGVVDSLSSKSLCGCSYCERIMVHFYVAIRSGKVSVVCNRLRPFLLFFEPLSKRKNGNANRKFPPSKRFRARRMYLRIGNKDVPRNGQLVGCVDKFIYHGMNIGFNSVGSKVRSSCSMRCINNNCNNGACIARYMATQWCDCRATALNGRYCNQSLNIYLRGGNNTFEFTSWTKKTYMKFTWKALLPRNYCLLVIVLSKGRRTIWTDGTHLRVDSTIISNVDTEGLNFVSLNISKSIVIIKSKNKESKYKFGFHDIRRFHVGLSEADGTCETFVGAYDIYFYEGPWKQMIQRREGLTTLSVDRMSLDNMPVQPVILLGIFAVLVVFITLLCVLILMLLCKRRTTNHRRNSNDMEGIELDVTNNSASTPNGQPRKGVISCNIYDE